MRAFLDANVLFSASTDPEAVARQLWKVSESGLVDLVSSRLAIQQTSRNLAQKSPHDAQELAELLSRLEVIGPTEEPDPAWALDHEDGTLLATAIACRATHFITGDKHFRHLKDRDDLPIRVVSIREFLALVQGESNAS